MPISGSAGGSCTSSPYLRGAARSLPTRTGICSRPTSPASRGISTGRASGRSSTPTTPRPTRSASSSRSSTARCALALGPAQRRRGLRRRRPVIRTRPLAAGAGPEGRHPPRDDGRRLGVGRVLGAGQEARDRGARTPHPDVRDARRAGRRDRHSQRRRRPVRRSRQRSTSRRRTTASTTRSRARRARAPATAFRSRISGRRAR